MKEDMKPVVRIASSKRDFLEFPPETVRDMGHALYLAQCGDKPSNAKPLRGFAGASVLELIEYQDGDAYRAVHTVRFSDAVYVLHCFQKEYKSGVSAPQQDVNLIKNRLNVAEWERKRWTK